MVGRKCPDCGDPMSVFQCVNKNTGKNNKGKVYTYLRQRCWKCYKRKQRRRQREKFMLMLKIFTVNCLVK